MGIKKFKGQYMNGSIFSSITYMNGSIFSMTRYMIGVSFTAEAEGEVMAM